MNVLFERFLVGSMLANGLAAIGSEGSPESRVTEASQHETEFKAGTKSADTQFARSDLSWEVGWTKDPKASPAHYVSATVPGAVQLDWARAEGWPPYWQGENFRSYSWMEDVYWVYRTHLARPKMETGQRLMLVCGGVDYACAVRLDGKVMHSQEGMFSQFTLDLANATNGALIEIIVSPAPKTPVPASMKFDIGRKEARQSCKPAVAYGWDFHPRLIPLGIWEDTYLEVRPSAGWLENTEIIYNLSDDFSVADLHLRTEGIGLWLRWTLRAPAGSMVGMCEGPVGQLLDLRLAHPVLWWPLSEGEPALYKSTVELLDEDRRVIQTVEQRAGLRRLRLIMSPGQFDRGVTLPASQPAVPVTFEVNGRAIFARGANWVCPDIFPGTMTSERYRRQLELFAGAHLNLLRSWGGAIVNKNAFFDLCDELGIMVWQEFPLACNNYEGTPAYLRVLDQESRAIIRRLRPHASLALWCGGNELFNSWSGMTMQSAALRLLGRNCYDLDPDRPFLPTSPLVGIRHGDYRFCPGSTNDYDWTVFQCYPQQQATAYMEFGVSGPANANLLKKIIPAGELWPMHTNGSWAAHHAFGAWQPDSWLSPEVAKHYFGPPKSLEQLVDRLQLIQAQGLKAIYEEARRQKPVCSTAVCWVFNEPWPCAANNSLVSWPAEPKPAYHAVAAANRPLMASARIPRFDWKPGAEFSAELFLLNDTPHPAGSFEIGAQLEVGKNTVPLGNWNCPGSPAGTHAVGPVVHGTVPAAEGETFKLVIDVAGHPEWSSTYILAFSRKDVPVNQGKNPAE